MRQNSYPTDPGKQRRRSTPPKKPEVSGYGIAFKRISPKKAARVIGLDPRLARENEVSS